MNPGALGTAPLIQDIAATPSNVITYGVSFASAVDDNASNPGNLGYGEINAQSSLRPRADVVFERTRISSRIFYGPGFTYSSNIRSFNSTSQAAGGELEYRFSKRLSLHLRNSFFLTSNPYDNWVATTEVANVGLLGRTNASTLASETRSVSEQLHGDLVYQLGRHTSIGTGGSFANLNYQTLQENSAPGTSVESQLWSGNAFYSHQFAPRYSFTVQYKAQSLSSHQTEGQFLSFSHQFLVFLTITPKANFQLSIFAGPERTSFNDSLLGLAGAQHSSDFSISDGLTFMWQGAHNGLSASFVQQTADGGLNGGGAVLARTANLQIEHQMTASVRVSLFGLYVSNHQLDPNSRVFLSDSASAGLQLTKALNTHLLLSLSAFRQQFIEGNGIPANGFQQRSHDVGTISLSYNFSRPLGR